MSSYIKIHCACLRWSALKRLVEFAVKMLEKNVKAYLCLRWYFNIWQSIDWFGITWNKFSMGKQDSLLWYRVNKALIQDIDPSTHVTVLSHPEQFYYACQQKIISSMIKTEKLGKHRFTQSYHLYSSQQNCVSLLNFDYLLSFNVIL